MKKVIIAVAIVLGTANSAFAWNWGWFGAPNLLNKETASIPTSPPPKKNYLEDILNLLEKQLNTNKQQLEKSEEIYNSITGGKKTNIPQVDYSSFFLKNPETIYERGKPKEYKSYPTGLSASVTKILHEEELLNSADFVRVFISKRLRYGAAIDKAVSLQTFEEAEKRFQHISELLKKIETTEDLKSIAELQVRVNSVLAMIQNENAKLKMVAHFRNAENTLTSHQRYKHNVKVFSRHNQNMPSIKSIR